ncbi:hypothetical protein GCM10009632_38950 [Mycolicibacterium alvei]|uniref:Uncharacterized protein n=1 Tax=Mycolicibacterium alvei TaxID=67081 RepID=A0A6N4UQZ5_9MYCO|nr:hypothetical protein MALV_25810 [Mycolicibacterium alvei]
MRGGHGLPARPSAGVNRGLPSTSVPRRSAVNRGIRPRCWPRVRRPRHRFSLGRLDRLGTQPVEVLADLAGLVGDLFTTGFAERSQASAGRSPLGARCSGAFLPYLPGCDTGLGFSHPGEQYLRDIPEIVA